MIATTSHFRISRRIFCAGCRPGLGGAALAVFVFAATISSVRAQNSTFTHDTSGNLLTQISETVGLPQIIGQPQMQIVTPGATASFSVVVADTRGVSYQWYSNTTAISGATADALFLTNMAASYEGQYSVIVSNSLGPVASQPAFLYYDSDGDGLPDSWEMAHFGNLNQTATGDYDGDGVDNLQEFLDGTDPTDANSVQYRIFLANDGGTVVASPNQSSYSKGQVVTLTATGSTAVPFHAWTGDVTSRSSSITVTMSTNLNLFAHFLPFTIKWTNFYSGDWSVASNWFPNLSPGSNESVIIPQQVVVTLNSDVNLHDFTLGTGDGGPELTGTGRLSISGTGTWTGGTMSGSGATIIQPGATLNVATFIGYAGVYQTTRTLENGGTINWGGGNWYMNDAVLTNDPGSSFQIFGSAAFTFGGGAPRFDNAGTFAGGSNGPTSFNEVAFDNYGTVNAMNDTLTMGGGGLQAGTVNILGNATLALGGTYTGNPVIMGAGTFEIVGGNSTLGGTINVTGSNIFNNGSVDFIGNYTCTNNVMAFTGGEAYFDGSGTVSPNILNLNGIMGGAQNVTVNGAMNWSGGTMNGSGRTIIRPGVTLTLATFTGYGGISQQTRTLENGGTVIWGGGTWNMNDAVITNDPGASFQLQGPITFNYQGGSPRFDNAGYLYAASNGPTSFYVAFDNFGAVDLMNDTLTMGSGGLQAGTVGVPAGTTLALGGSFTGNPSITGAGTFEVVGGTSTLGGTVNVSGSNVFNRGSIDFIGAYTCTNNVMAFTGGEAYFDGSGTVSPNILNLNGTLGGGQNVTVTGAMNWTGGTMNGSGRTIISHGATLTLATFTGYGGVYQITRTLENGGTVVWGGGNWNLNDAVITNDPGASFQVSGPVGFNYGGGSPRYDNAGTFFPSPYGTTGFNGITLDNFATINLSGGILSLGSYLDNSNSVLNYFLSGNSPGVTYGQIQVPGSVTLGGTLNVTITNHYIPATNQQFTILTSGNLQGAYAAFHYPTNGLAMSLSNNATAAVVQITTVNLQQSNLPAASGMISWWRGESNALDSIGTNNGSLSNGVTYAPGQVGTGFQFDGSTGAVVIPDSASLRPDSVTVEAWVKIFSTNAIQLVFAKPLGTGTLDSYGLALENGVPLAAICDDSGFGTFLSDTAPLSLGQWHHMAFTFDNSTGYQALYTDGALVASGTAGKSMQFDDHPLLLGADNDNTVPDNFLDGQIDEASIYNRALTTGEIESIYNVGVGGKQVVSTTGPILYVNLLTPSGGRIYWSTNYPNYHLEYNAAPNGSNWAASWLTPVVLGTNYVVTNSFSSQARFYRLSSVMAPYNPPPPSLILQRPSPGFVRLLWPIDDDRPFHLQSAANLTNWTPVSAPPFKAGLNNIVTNAINGTHQFYRLSN